jgi:hypothetical protein
MVLLFLDGKRELEFSGFWAGATWDDELKTLKDYTSYKVLK